MIAVDFSSPISQGSVVMPLTAPVFDQAALRQGRSPNSIVAACQRCARPRVSLCCALLLLIDPC